MITYHVKIEVILDIAEKQFITIYHLPRYLFKFALIVLPWYL